jgi:hypothetical protein
LLKNYHTQEKLEEQMTPLEITLLILVLTIVAFITGKIPFSVISAGIMLSLIMTGVMEPATFGL